MKAMNDGWLIISNVDVIYIHNIITLTTSGVTLKMISASYSPWPRTVTTTNDNRNNNNNNKKQINMKRKINENKDNNK